MNGASDNPAAESPSGTRPGRSDPSDRSDRTGGPPAEVGEDLERRIVRRLDGELDAPAEEALTRELLRDPAAHRMMDDYAAADRAAGAALEAAFAGQGGELPASCRAVASRSGGPWPAGRAAAVAAVAAAMVLAIGVTAWVRWGGPTSGADGAPGPGGAQAGLVQRTDHGAAGMFPATAATQAGQPTEPLPAGVEGLMWRMWQPRTASPGAGDLSVPLPTIQGPRRSTRAVDRHMFTVYDEAEKAYYLLGVDRVRTQVHAVGKDL